MISVQHVKKIFPAKSEEVVAVKDVNLEIKEGEIFGIIGYSGAGKSTLIRMFNGLEMPTEGSIYIEGKDITRMKESKLRLARQEIGMIFQHFHLLWSRTVYGNIAFPLEIAGIPKKERDERVRELIQLVGLEGKENAYPSELSGGQKQRVGIARALANKPKVLLSDEATSALDPDTTDAILDLLVDINKKLGLTIILITHEMHVIKKICHRVAVMEKGKIVETGPVLEVFKHPEQPVTKRFVGQVTDAEDMKETVGRLLEKYQSGKIVKLTFVGEVAEEPIISTLIQKQLIVVNILHGNISHTRHGAYGTLFIHMDGKEEEVRNAIQFLLSRQIGVEVIEHV
ncbi:methionine ABC transporter ATP-binding protein [Fervidibacillus halotolerans]|uniref:Methionine ABC transporter ATP-binding protein n=1 Tax=Fervidibacillus halotolerans TaxID=2980027 RepID=A0A9E8RWM2_9BACI|nr:methionine ABC transporter ATP-binding protein [Fervidibacillus halotolerans]WAA11910.1 methionine ABC transporter ATP-binding protein [Fervidibacillus halotolerans]